MILRSTIERTLPLRDGEKKLTDGARRYAFRGIYFLSGRVIMAETKPNYHRQTQNNYPYMHTVTRESQSGERTFSGDSSLGYVYNKPEYDVASEINDSEALARINRVERIARRIKVATAATVLVAAGAFSFAGFRNGNADNQDSPVNPPAVTSVESCADVVDGSEALIPLGTVRAKDAQSLGQMVCQVGEFNYIIVSSAAG